MVARPHRPARAEHPAGGPARAAPPPRRAGRGGDRRGGRDRQGALLGRRTRLRQRDPGNRPARGGRTVTSETPTLEELAGELEAGGDKLRAAGLRAGGGGDPVESWAGPAEGDG